MSEYSVKKPFTVLVGVVLCIVLGVVSFLGLNTDLLPTIDLPYIAVYTVYPGATPERVETEVTKTIEQAVATTTGLESLTSVSRENVSIVIMEFSSSTNMDSAMLELSNSIDGVKGRFDSLVQSPVMLKINPNMLPVSMVTVDVDGMDIKQLTEYVNSTVAPQIERQEGVATVDVTGGVSDHIEIRLNQSKIDEINDSIVKAVSSKLYSTKKDLDKAQRELTNAKTELENKESEAYDKLAEGSAALDAGTAQAQAIASEKQSLEAKIRLAEGAGKIVDGIKQINRGIAQIDAALPSLIAANNGATQLAAQLSAMGIDTGRLSLADIQRRIALIPSEVMPEEQKAAVNGLISGLVSSGAATDSQTLPEVSEALLLQIDNLNLQKAELGKKREELVKTLNDMGYEFDRADADNRTALDSYSADIQAEVAEMQESLKKATALAKQMENTLKMLQDNYAALEKAKMQTSVQLAAAQVQLTDAQSQLDSGMQQYKSARDEALKKANIDSLVTQETLSAILTAQNFAMPAGYLTDGETKYTVKVGDVFQNLSEVENLLLIDMGLDGVDPIHLNDVADIEIKDNSKDSYVRVNGNPAVMVSISKSSTSSTAKVSDACEEAYAEMEENNPSLHFTVLYDQGVYIDMIINTVLKNLAFGGILAIIVLAIFLKDIKPTFIVAVSIPISLMFAVVLMYFGKVTMNIMSLSGLALAVGMLVDNSIVTIENIYRLRNLGYSRAKAAVYGAKQVAGAITASTLTTICVFLPIVFTDGLSRQLFVDMGLTIGFALIASLVTALTVVPALSATVLRSSKQPSHKLFDKAVNAYEKLLSACLSHKWVVILLSAGLLVFSAYQLTKMPMTLIPSMDSTQMTMSYSLDKDAGFTEDDLIADSEFIGEVIAQTDGVQTVGMTMGSSGMSAMMSGGGDNLDMSFYIVLDENKTLSNDEIAKSIKSQTAGLKGKTDISTSTMDLSALTGSGISVTVKGTDLDTLAAQAAKIKTILEGVEGVASVNDGSDKAGDEVRIEVDKTRAAKYNLTVAQVYQTVSKALTESTTAATMTIDGTDMKAIIYASSLYDLQTINDMKVTTVTEDDEEKDILLKDICSVYMAKSPQSIPHENQSRYRTVSAKLREGYNATLVAREAEKALADYTAPKGYTYEMGGENETTMDVMTDLVKMIALACVFIYLIMVAQFQSLKSPFIVIFTIPLAFTGGMLALLITNQPLSMVAMIGFLVLAGVVVNNGIVFVDYINQLRLEGMEKRRAILQTGKDRIRPVLMTALTTILANVVMAMGVGMGAEMTMGMATVTVGGLAYATLLTLFLVPSLYDIFNKKDMKKVELEPDEV